jgi:DtxR family Mn-dependent transcriptional regulator
LKLRELGLSENLEDYLEKILELERVHKVARVRDIAEKLGVLPGSVSGALKTLSEKGFVNYAPYSYITLTPKGRTIAAEVRRRHTVIRDFLQGVLLLAPDQAEENACRIEHAIDRAAVDRLVQFIEYILSCPRTGEDWIQKFVKFYSTNEVDTAHCLDCLRDCLERFQKGPTVEE